MYVQFTSCVYGVGSAKSSPLPLFHALTGCDQVSFFAGRGKKRAWKQYDDLIDVLDSISNCPLQGNVNTALSTLERFTVLLYDRTNAWTSINEM